MFGFEENSVYEEDNWIYIGYDLLVAKKRNYDTITCPFDRGIEHKK
jgi:hypothetical protein